MAVIESSVKVDRTVEQVWSFITNLENQKKLSTYITGIEVNGPLGMGTQYKIETTSFGMKNVTTNEVVSFEPNKKLGIKTFAAPPAAMLVLLSRTTGTGASGEIRVTPPHQ